MALNTFSNGLRLVYTSRPDKRVACAVLYIAGGSQCESNYQLGLSEYLTNMLMMGTRQHPSASLLLEYAKKNGILLTAHNSKESVSISAVCQKEKIEMAINLLSEIAFDSTFDMENGNVVRNRQLDMIDMRAESPTFQLTKLTNSSLYYRTGLSSPKIGTAISVSRFNSMHAKEFMERIFTPKNTIISVVADENQQRIYDIVKENFFDRMEINAEQYKKLKYVSKVDWNSGEVKGRVKRLNQTRFAVTFPTVSFKDKEKHLIEIVKPIILKRLNKSLSYKDYFYDTKIITKYYANNGKITFELSVDGENAREHIIDFVKSIVENIKQKPISVEEFEAEKQVYLTNYIIKYDNVLEYTLQSAKQLAIKKEMFSENAQKLIIEMLKCEDINKLLGEIIDLRKVLIVYLGQALDLNFNDIIKLN